MHFFISSVCLKTKACFQHSLSLRIIYWNYNNFTNFKGNDNVDNVNSKGEDELYKCIEIELIGNKWNETIS